MQFGKLRTIKSKIGLCIVITTVVAMGLGSSLFILFATSWFQGRTQNELDALTDLVSSSCEAALDFDDQAAAEIIINSLRAHRDIVAGCLGSRHLMAVLLFFGFFVSYALRINISVAIVAMVNQSKCLV